MSQVPPPPGLPPTVSPGYAYQAPPPRKSNVPAILSLICGLLQCVPVLTGLLAVIFGFIGIKRANNPAVGGGKPLAIIGLILGLLGLIGWTIFLSVGGAAFFWAKGQIEKPKEVTVACVRALAQGDLNAAMTHSHSTMDKQDMANLVAYLKPMGSLQDLSVDGFDIKDNMVSLRGIATFQNKSQAFRSGIVREKDSWKVGTLEFRSSDRPYTD